MPAGLQEDKEPSKQVAARYLRGALVYYARESKNDPITNERFIATSMLTGNFPTGGLTFQYKSTGDTYRYESGVWRGPDNKSVRLTRLQEDIVSLFLNSPNPRFSADQIQDKLRPQTLSRGDPTAYRKHVALVNNAFDVAFGFELFLTTRNAGIRSGGAKSRHAEYRLSPDIVVMTNTSPASTSVPASIASYRQALLSRRDWLTIRPILSSGTEVAVEDLYVELFLRHPKDAGLMGAEGPETAMEQESARTAAAIHYVTAESLLARTSGRTVIIGPPGSGKTTLVKWICAYLLKQRTATEVTPIPVGLRDFGEAFHGGSTSGLIDYALSTVLGKAAAATVARSMEEAGNKLPVLFLLDGWDEVPSAMRAEVLCEIDRTAADLPVVITSRVNAAAILTRYPQTPLFELGALADGAVSEVCTRYGKARDRIDLVPSLLQLLENSPSLWSLAGNPYLLTLLCEVVFAAPELPKPAEISPIWVLSHAIDLIRSDYNASHQNNPLTREALRRIEQLAHRLSFAGKTKRISFEPDVELGQSYEEFISSPAGQARFFSATEMTRTSFSFVHLRMQEYLAARWAAQDGASRNLPRLKQYLLSRTWREEARFAAALLLSADEPPAHELRATMRALVRMPDQTGESIRVVAGVLAAAGIHDGGRLALGIDLRAILWQRISSDPLFLNEDTQSLLELDPAYLLSSLMKLEKPDDMLYGHLYRFLPLGLRRAKLDPQLAVNPILSWVIGLPGRGFPTRESLQDLAEIAANETTERDERIRALRDLGSARAQSEVERLVPLLGVSDDALSTAAAETLGKIGGQRAAIALASALISLEESRARQSPGLASALLNALAVDGYGAIEPHSRNLLVEHINTAPRSCANLELTLLAVARTPLHQPPQRILEILEEQSPGQESLRTAAAAVLHGITDPVFLNRALELLKTEANRKVRTQMLSAIPFVPVNYRDSGELWRLCRSRSTNEASHALRLILRTVARYPNHPMAKSLDDFVENTLERIARNQSAPLDQQILHGLQTIRPGSRITPRLLPILRNTALEVDTRTRAAEALALCHLTEANLDSIQKQLAGALRLGKEGTILAAALAVTLFVNRPAMASGLLRDLRRKGDRERVACDALLKAALRAGYLIFDDHVVDPDGRVQRATKTRH